MISYSNLGKWGRLGNQLFEIMSTIGLAKTYNETYTFPIWTENAYLKNKIPSSSRFRDVVHIPEKAYHYTPEHWESEIPKNTGKHIDITGWLQSEKYWNCDQKLAQEIFEFEPVFLTRIKEKYKDAFSKPTIAISIRRGDFVGNSNYDLLPIEYYIGALFKNFPDYHNYNIFIFSDDLLYCRHHFQTLSNVYYSRNEGAIQQLALMSQCDHFIISQSTFSWWGAYLGQKDSSIVVRPNYNTAGELLKSLSEKDYWPERWNNIYDHKKEKIDLSDVTFTIPVFYDHEDRAQNLKLCIQYLEKYNTNIIIGEQGGPHFTKTYPQYRYVNFPYNTFHRTKMLNEMAAMSETPIIANWDCDVIVNPMQMVDAVKSIREGSDMVYPYDGRFGRVERNKWYIKLRDADDTAIVKDQIFSGMKPQDSLSVGGAIIFNKKSFFEGGMENENFISYAPEDQERFYRFNKLGYKVHRTRGPIYHIDHFVGNNSWTNHSLYKDNEKEFFRIRGIENLKDEVSKWTWIHPYTNQYYEEIMGGSTKSRDEIFKLPEFKDIKSIIDVGCGIGQWGQDLANYKGVDFKIPKELLVIPESNYAEYDLTKNEQFPFNEKFDLALCLEVCEHLPEEKAESIVKLLTSLAPKVLFSAAIPGQGGRNHINEKWQTYWVELFKKQGYYPHLLDIRNNTDIEIWYRNNMILFVNYETNEKVTDYIHPHLYTNIVGTLTNWRLIQPYL